MKKSVEESDWVQPKNDAGEGTAQNFANAFIFLLLVFIAEISSHFLTGFSSYRGGSHSARERQRRPHHL